MNYNLESAKVKISRVRFRDLSYKTMMKKNYNGNIFLLGFYKLSNMEMLLQR